jgi:hypothetical protein
MLQNIPNLPSAPKLVPASSIIWIVIRSKALSGFQIQQGAWIMQKIAC